MKTKILIAATVAAAAALVAYLVKSSGTNNDSPKTTPVKRSHHLTNVFAHAKNHGELIQ